MGLARKIITKVMEEGTEEFYSSGFLIALLAFLLFSGYKGLDYAIGGYFGYLVETYPQLQWVFQISAFFGLGLGIHFTRQYRRAVRANRQRNGHTTQQIRELMDKVDQADAQIRLERERYRKIIDHQTEFVCKFLPDGTLTFVNRALYTFAGFTHWSQIMGLSMYQFIGDEEAAIIKEKLKLIKWERPRERHTQRMVNAVTNEIRYVDWINCGVFDHARQLTKFQAVGRDVTTLVEAQERTRLSEEKYRLLFTHMVAGFAIHRIICDDDDNVCDYAFTEVNPAFEELFGFERVEVLGRTILDIMPNTEPNIIIRFGTVANTGKPDNFECYFADINKWFNVTAFKPHKDHFAATFVDITHHRDRTGKRTRATDPGNLEMKGVD